MNKRVRQVSLISSHTSDVHVQLFIFQSRQRKVVGETTNYYYYYYYPISVKTCRLLFSFDFHIHDFYFIIYSRVPFYALI